MSNSSFWIAVGLVGQILFTSRFLVQWIASERARRSLVPAAFWWLSLGGGATRCSSSGKRSGSSSTCATSC